MEIAGNAGRHWIRAVAVQKSMRSVGCVALQSCSSAQRVHPAGAGRYQPQLRHHAFLPSPHNDHRTSCTIALLLDISLFTLRPQPQWVPYRSSWRWLR